MKIIIKKIYITMFVIYIILSNVFVFASTRTETRTNNDLKVTYDIEVNSSNRNKILKTPKVNESEKIYDFAELLTSSQEEELYIEIENFIEKYKLDMVIVTIDENNKSSAMNYADDFYDYNDFGIGKQHNGLLFLIDMDTREMWISTTGKAIRVFSASKIDSILDYTYNKISVKDYYGCASQFIQYASKYANSSLGIGMKILKVGGVPTIITLIFIIYGLSRHKTVHIQNSAQMYMKPVVGKEGLVLTKREDKYITSHTSRYRRDSGSSSGGSSSHSSSSGRSHGGGGRSF